MALATKILPKAFLDRVKRTRPIYYVGRRVRFAIGSRMGSRYVPALGGKAHFNDFMLTSTEPDHVESYRRGAVQFVEILGRSLAAAGRGWSDIANCLEIGCGYGRIVRELKTVLAPQAICVCDVIDEGATFTSAEMGVRKVPLVEAMGREATASFDLIYLLSVYTHLDRSLIEANLAKVATLLKKDGVLVFTTHGKGSALTAERYDQYWLDKTKLNARLDKDSFFYERYPYYYADYGLTWIVEDEVKAMVARIAPDLAFVKHEVMAVDGHQDVFVYRKG